MAIDEHRFYQRLSADFANGVATTQGSRLDVDLGLDSLAMLELREALETVAGRAVPDQLWLEVSTAGELYDWFSTLEQQSAADRMVLDQKT